MPTRRDFLMSSTAGFALASATAGGAQGAPAASAGTGEIKVWVTAGAKRLAAETPLRWQAGGTGPAIALNAGRQFQDILGFGGAFTDAACYMINELAAPAREQLLKEFFDPSGMGLNVCRTCVGSSDYATKVYSYDDGEEDPELKRFSIEHDHAYILPVIRQARGINPRLYLLASPWSPPGWMKAGGSMLGGSMRKKYFPHYAEYFSKFLKAYADAGVRIDAISSQNEVDTDQDARMPACLWGQEYEMEFAGKFLGPALKRNNLDTKIWLLDHNYSLWGRAICMLDDPDVNRFADGVAWHGYVGGADAMTRVHEAHPHKHMYWTEGGPDYTDPGYQTDWAKWSASFAGILRNWSRCIIAWNLALDEKGRPNVGPFPCGGVVTIHSQTKQITRSGQYWALSHYARAFRPGARRFQSEGEIEGVSHVGASNPDGSSAVILTNIGPERKVRLTLAGKSVEVTLAGGSITTLSWS